MAASLRQERLARNEALFRVANERMAGWEEQHSQMESELYFCECANPDCRAKVSLLKADYERVRSDSRLFVVAPGHEIPDVEEVIERHEGWVIVEKPGDVDHVVKPLDPRDPS